MKKINILFLILSAVLFSTGSNGQTDSTKQKAKLDFVYLGLGGGATFNSGVLGGVNCNFIFTNNWGLGFNFNANTFDAADLPDDYVGETDLYFETLPPPRDVLYALSFPILKEFPDKTNKIRGGIALGPSIVMYNKNNFSPNPNYSWFESNYVTTQNTESTLGIYYCLKGDFWFSKRWGVEFSVNGNINTLYSFTGFELFLQYKIYRSKHE